MNSAGQKNLARLHVYMNGRDRKRRHARSLVTQDVCEPQVLDRTRAHPMDDTGQYGKWQATDRGPARVFAGLLAHRPSN
jgi:hypothetical protein